MNEPLANWNGVMLPLSEVRVSVRDRAFLFGDAIYEVLRVYGGRPFLCTEHFQRLRRSLAEIEIVCEVDRLLDRMQHTLRQSGVSEGTIYIQITRGEAPRTHHFPDPPTIPNELIYVSRLERDPYAEYRAAGARVVTVPDWRWERCDIKSVNLLANCLAAQRAHAAGCVEALLVAPDGAITEGSHTSLFGVRDGRILTTPLGTSILPGITRALVTRLAARAGLPLHEVSVRQAELDQVDELFLTGTSSEVLPIVRVDEHVIGDGRPGPITQRLQRGYAEFVAEWLSAPEASDVSV
jgi:D-alanine transaminase